MSFDPKVHVTAGKLRSEGARIDASIPDAAFVPNRAVRTNQHRFGDHGAKSTFAVVVLPPTVWEMP